MMNCPVTARALETERAHTFKEKTKPLQQLLEDVVVVASGVVILTES